MEQTAAAPRRRIDIIDAVRGIAIIAMVFYHALYDINDMFGFQIRLFDLLSVLEPPFAGAFILLAGVSCRFSHSNFRRGAKVLALALVITVATLIFSAYSGQDETIYFGILHFMGCAILLFALLKPLLDKIPPRVAYPAWALLFIFTYTMPATRVIGIPHLFGITLPASLAAVKGLFIIGIPGLNFMSADYFPMIPWFFLFLLGTLLGIPIREHKLPERFYTQRVPFFAFAGRHTLLIYIVHQPIVYAILWAMCNIFNLKF